jgi:LmbE family N-acetylglucosaminyl deacetylase
MTDGDGFPDGVKRDAHLSRPTTKDYLEYGEERRKEALKALATLGMEEQDVTFLGFPDGGLCCLLWKFRSDPQAYTSPFTRKKHPQACDLIIPQTDYNGHDLRSEIAQLLTDFRPNLLAMTPPEDQHPDHCATYYFVKEALMDSGKKDPSIDPDVLTFLIHFASWPSSQASGTGPHIDPPESFPDRKARWISFPLEPWEVERKRKAILEYHTQLLVMDQFLLSFSKGSEWFIVSHQGLAKEKENMPCCEK